MSTYEQAVAYSFPDDPGVTLTFTPLDSILINAAGEIIPKTARTALTTTGTIDLPVPDGTGRGAWRWSVSLPDAELGIFELGHHVGTAQLATLLAMYNERTAVSPNVLAQLIARYGLTTAQDTWLGAGITAVPDAADLIPDAPADGTQYGRQDGAWAAISAVSDVGDLTTAGLTAANMLRVAMAGGLEERTPAQVRADIGAETAGAAAAAQAYAIQRANHTGTQTLSTISDAGTMAAQSTANYYATSAFSASPTAGEPLKADGSGGVSLKKITAASGLPSVVPITGKGAVSQTANLLELQDSTGAVLAKVDKNGAVTLGTSITSTAADITLGTTSGYVFRGVRSIAWADAASALFFQIGGGTENFAFTGGFGGLPDRISFTAGTVVQFSTYRPHPVPSHYHEIIYSSVATNTILPILKLSGESSGTAAAGFGGDIDLRLQSSTTKNTKAARIAWSWTIATHASRTAALTLYASDYGGERTGLQIGANGTAATIGVLGATPIPRQTVAANASDLATAITLVNDIKSKLQSFGFFN